MDRSITASEANRNFSEVLRQVEHGDVVAVTRHGRKIARIVPLTAEEAERDAKAALLRAYLERARERPVQNIGPWTRDELYER